MSSQGANNGPGQGAGQQFVKFSRQSAQRIAKVVRHVEQGERGQPGITFEHPLPAAKNVRVCSWTGTWSHEQTHVIQFTSPSTAFTATAFNSYFGWKDTGSIGSGVVVKQSGVWQLHSIDPVTVQGITAVQTTAVGSVVYGVLGCEAVNDPTPPPGESSGASDVRTYLRWFAVTACST